MTRLRLLPLLLLSLCLPSCEDDDDTIAIIDAPDTYTFTRDGASTVSYDGQTTRLLMADELLDALLDPDNYSEADLLSMYRNEGPNGEDVTPFANPALNDSEKSLRSKTAASRDYFAANATDAATVRNTLEGWLTAQADEVWPRWNELASAGQAGQIADGTSTRWVNEQGLEYNQAFGKSLLGALVLDQTINNYLSPAVLDEADNRANNEAGITADGKPYTTMEHKWDEAYGYVYGVPAADDNFLLKYIGRVENDPDYAGIAEEIERAFIRGRAAIVAGDYAERDEQAAILRDRLSKIVAIRAVYYLMQGATAIENNEMGTAFHDLSEGYGFIYSLQFTNDGSGRPYLERNTVLAMLDTLMKTGDNGLWTLTPAVARDLAQRIATAAAIDLNEAAS